MVTTRALLPTRNSGASIVGVNADMITVPVTSPFAVGGSAYVCSKMAQIKLLEFISAENPDLFVVSVHPGVVDTDMAKANIMYENIPPNFWDDGKAPPVLCLIDGVYGLSPLQRNCLRISSYGWLAKRRGF